MILTFAQPHTSARAFRERSAITGQISERRGGFGALGFCPSGF
jgi:hypothetical protein